MLKDFVAFDIEMPTQAVFAVSAIGVTVVENGAIRERFYSLIDPQTRFSKYVVQLIGITPEMVEGQPTLPEIWKRIGHYFRSGKTIVSHGAHGDILTLAASLKRYGIEWKEEISYLCTCDLTLGEDPDFEHHSLDFLCEHFGVELAHHNAQSDSDGCAEVLLKYIENGADVEKYIKTVEISDMLERNRVKRLEDRLRARKSNTLKSLAEPKETAYNYEKQFYRFFEEHRGQKTPERKLARDGIIRFGTDDGAIRKLAGELNGPALENLLPQRSFACFEMYRLYVFAFNRSSFKAKNFLDILVSLPSFDALEGINLKEAEHAVGGGKFSLDILIEKLARQNAFGYNVLAVMLMLESEIYESDPISALNIIKRILLFSPFRDGALITRTIWMLSRIIASGKADESVVRTLLPKKHLRRAALMAIEDSPEEAERIESFYAYTLSRG